METAESQYAFCSRCYNPVKRNALRCSLCNAPFAGNSANRARRLVSVVKYGGRPITLDEETMELDVLGACSMTIGLQPDDLEED